MIQWIDQTAEISAQQKVADFIEQRLQAISIIVLTIQIFHQGICKGLAVVRIAY